MKKSKYIILNSSILALGFILQASAWAESIDFEGHTYTIAKLGRIAKVAPANLNAKLTRIQADGAFSNSNPPDCASISATISRRQYLFEDCAANPERSICKTLRDSLRLLAEGRVADDGTPIDSSITQSWKIGAPVDEVGNESGLRQAVAQKIAMPVAKIQLVYGQDLQALTKFSGALQLNYGDDSLTAKVAKLVKFDDGNLLQAGASGALVSRNSLVACDLLQGQITVDATASANLTNIDKVSDTVLDILWKGYQALAQNSTDAGSESTELMEAVVIGYQIGLALPPVQGMEAEPLLRATEIFRRLYSQAESVPTLRFFSSREGMHAVAYPDQSSSQNTAQVWRLQ